MNNKLVAMTCIDVIKPTPNSDTRSPLRKLLQAPIVLTSHRALMASLKLSVKLLRPSSVPFMSAVTAATKQNTQEKC